MQRGNSILVASTSTDGKRHRVRLDGGRVGQCDCEAGLLGKHRAAVAIRLYERETGARVVAIKAGAALAMERYLRASEAPKPPARLCRHGNAIYCDICDSEDFPGQLEPRAPRRGAHRVALV